jgi:L-alanine-DL-glutamate epimerase-like enolase superfamily enzyme
VKDHKDDSRVIVGFDVCPIAVPLTEPFAISGGTLTVARNVLVRTVLRDGSVGYGEAAPFEVVSGETQASSVAALQGLTELLVGRDVSGWRALSEMLRPVLGGAPAARCAVEQSVIDALARHLGLSLVDYFGGGSGRLVTDLTIPSGDVAHATESARRAAECGFCTVKIKVASDRWETDVERVLAVVDVAPNIRVIADANGGFSLADGRRFLAGLADSGVRLTLFEQPVAADDIVGLARLEQEFDVPVCADESVRSPADAVRVVRVGGISSINVKLMKFGVVDALDVIAVARSAGMSCMVGGMIETAVSMSFSAALALANQPLFSNADLDTPLFMESPVAGGGISYAGEAILLPTNCLGTGVDASQHFPVLPQR